jgi:uracil phosphoribosyltransferase
MKKNLHVLNHPLVQHQLTLMRMKDTSAGPFRELMRSISVLIGYELLQSLAVTKKKSIETYFGTKTQGQLIDEEQLGLIPILRAGIGILEGFRQVLPNAPIGHIGLYRDITTHAVVEYFFKVPKDIDKRHLIVMDPMLATGQSAVAAVSRLKELNPKSVTFVCIVASPQGTKHFHDHHPDVAIYAASIDEGLDKRNNIIPGLGDAGDRLYGIH